MSMPGKPNTPCNSRPCTRCPPSSPPPARHSRPHLLFHTLGQGFTNGLRSACTGRPSMNLVPSCGSKRAGLRASLCRWCFATQTLNWGKSAATAAAPTRQPGPASRTADANLWPSSFSSFRRAEPSLTGKRSGPVSSCLRSRLSTSEAVSRFRCGGPGAGAVGQGPRRPELEEAMAEGSALRRRAFAARKKARAPARHQARVVHMLSTHAVCRDGPAHALRDFPPARGSAGKETTP